MMLKDDALIERVLCHACSRCPFRSNLATLALHAATVTCKEFLKLSGKSSVYGIGWRQYASGCLCYGFSAFPGFLMLH